VITVYTLAEGRLQAGGLDALRAGPVWIDLLQPTPEEEDAVELAVGIAVPTREEMQEIEASSRLYKQGDALFVTAPLLTAADTPDPTTTPVTFILTPRCTVTVRYGSPQSFAIFAGRVQRQAGIAGSADAVLCGLLETIIDRLADVLERIGGELDAVSRRIFRREDGDTDLQRVLQTLGCQGDLTSRARDSLLGLDRVVTFLSQRDESAPHKEMRLRMKTATRDLRSLTEHAAFLSGKINFLLDATLGMISIQQNNTIKIFSVVAVIFLPPTLIASIYGMNFQLMPELNWPWGYPLALLLMVVCAILPYWYFKRRGWL